MTLLTRIHVLVVQQVIENANGSSTGCEYVRHQLSESITHSVLHAFQVQQQKLQPSVDHIQRRPTSDILEID